MCVSATGPDEGDASGSSSGDVSKAPVSTEVARSSPAPHHHKYHEALAELDRLQGELDIATSHSLEESHAASLLRSEVDGLRAELDRAHARMEVMERSGGDLSRHLV